MEYLVDNLVAASRLAMERLAGVVHMTPVLESAAFNRLIGARVFVKAENLQITGSFKVRGAYNTMASRNTRSACVAWSTGNFGIGAGFAAQLLHLRLTVFVPRSAPATKVDRIRSSGASIIFYDPVAEDGEHRAREYAGELGQHFLHPFDDDLVVAGNATVGIEALTQLAQLGLEPDVCLAPCGGAGLLAGVAAVTNRIARAHWIGVEPAGSKPTNGESQLTICDALVVRSRAMRARELCSHLAVRVGVVDDISVQWAMRAAHEYFNIALEPSGAIALAYLLENNSAFRGGTAMVLATGSNVASDVLATALSRPYGVAAT